MRTDVGAEISIVEEGVFFEAYIYKGRVEAGNEFLYFAQIKVPYRKIRIAAFMMQLH